MSANPRPADPHPTGSAAEISLEEWIAAGQACCGADHPDDDAPADADADPG